jgi:hypothetical protein
MRSFEFLFEAQLVTNNYYDPGNRSHDNYIPKIRAAIVDKNIPLYVRDVNKQDRTVMIPQDSQKSAMAAMASHIDNVKAGIKPLKAPIISGVDQETGEKIQFQLDKIYKKFSTKKTASASQERVNMGDVTEGIVGFACAARFEDTDSKITDADILTIGKRFFNQGDDSAELEVKDRTDDKLEIRVTMPSGSLSALKLFMESNGDAKEVQDKMGLSDEARKKLEKMLSQAASYMNTGKQPQEAVKKVKQFYTDGIKQIIRVYSDGGDPEQQRVNKVDLSIIVKGQQGEEFEEQTLSLLSLKAGSGAAQIGQVSGYAFDAIRRFWKSSFNYDIDQSLQNDFATTLSKYGQYKPTKKDPKKSTFIWNDSKQRDTAFKEIINGPIKTSYENAKQKIDSHIKGDRTSGEEDFIVHLQKGLLYHSARIEKADNPSSKTQGDEQVTVLILNPGGGKDFVELNFGPSLLEMLQYFNLKCSPVMSAEGGKGVYLRIEADFKPDMNTPEDIKKLALPGKGAYLVQFRSAIKQGAVRNTIEVGTQSKVLANVQNYIQTTPDDEIK